MAALPVLTAVDDPTWEAVLVRAFERSDLGVAVVRRCVDLADLLAAAGSGAARAVLLSSDLRRLDREALARLDAVGVGVVGLFPPGEEDAEQALRQLGIALVLPADADAGQVAAALVAAETARSARGAGALGYGDPAPLLPVAPLAELEPQSGMGRLVAVWGPTGAPGRTTVALGVASEAAGLGTPTLLVDADPYGGALAQVLGLLEEPPGLAAAARLANAGSLDVPALTGLARDLGGGLCLLPGIARADRWPELRPASIDVVLRLARALFPLTVLDCGFCLETDEELSFDTLAPRRNAATLSVLDAADVVLAVGSADPVGLHRLLRGLPALAEAVPAASPPTVVLNRVRRSAAPGNAATEAAAAVRRHAGLAPACLVPLDVPALDAAVAAGRPLREVAPSSPARLALAGLAAGLLGRAAQPRRRRRLLRGA